MRFGGGWARCGGRIEIGRPCIREGGLVIPVGVFTQVRISQCRRGDVNAVWYALGGVRCGHLRLPPPLIAFLTM